MPDDTTVLSLPLILPAQAQKHVTHNEALAMLDVIVQLAVINRNQTTPPALPSVGDRHIVAPSAIAAWAGQDGRIALWSGVDWQFTQALPGWTAFVLSEGKVVAFDGMAWILPAGSGGGAEQPLLGLNATANATNRLTVSSPATLFSHEGAGHQVKVNKAVAADTASLLFQTGFSGRAEMGTMGSDAFGIKVSATGSGFTTALSVAPTTGIVSLPEGVSANAFQMRDGTDVMKRVVFDLSSLPAGALRTYQMPNANGELAALGGVQTFNGNKTFSGVMTVSAATATFGSNTGNTTYSIGSGATLSGNSKTVNIATDGVSGSTTAVVIGPQAAGASGSVTVQGTAVTLGATVADFDMGAASARAARLGVGGATADVTNRLSVTAPGVLFSHAGAGVEATLNKAAAGDTAVLALKTGFSTRAQIGLLGSNDLSVRVSADGSAFNDVMTASAASGQVTLAQPVILTGQTADPGTPAEGTLWHNSTTGQFRGRAGGTTLVIDGQQDLPCLIPPSGELVHTTTGAGGTSTSTLAGAANRMDLFPFVPRAEMTIDRIGINCTTAVASALGKLVVYASDTLGRPSNLIVETSDLDLGTVGAKLATVALTLLPGRTYWLGVRHSSSATLSVWATTASPDINGGTTIVTTARKVLRRTVTYATAAPTSWGFTSAEINSALAPAIWLRIA